jgi:hypothetical protein
LLPHLQYAPREWDGSEDSILEIFHLFFTILYAKYMSVRAAITKTLAVTDCRALL